MGRGKSQARLEDLTLRKNHHTPSQALGCGGGGCPSVPRSRGRKGVGGGGHAGLMSLGAYRSLTFSIMPLPQRFHAGQGMGGVPEPFPSPLRRPQRSGAGKPRGSSLGS